eukprot:COSAG02_NODE_1016_length_15190_cov_128.667418_3_plen_152_part_00
MECCKENFGWQSQSCMVHSQPAAYHRPSNIVLGTVICVHLVLYWPPTQAICAIVDQSVDAHRVISTRASFEVVRWSAASHCPFKCLELSAIIHVPESVERPLFARASERRPFPVPLPPAALEPGKRSLCLVLRAPGMQSRLASPVSEYHPL